MVKRTHQTIWIVFALFLAYLVVVRLVITWAQVAPNQFGDTIAWVTNSDISFESLEIKQNWLGVEIEVEEALVEHDGFEIEAGRVAFDFNLFSPLVPRSSWGDYLTVERLAVLEYGLPSNKVSSGGTVDSFLSLNSKELATSVDISRLWKKVEVSDFSASIYQKETDWKINVDSFQAFKGARWSLAADFNLHYGQVLQGERFQLKASLLPNVFGGVESGDFTIKAFDAIRLERLAQLTPKKWHNVLPDGDLIPNLKGSISKSLLSNLNMELLAPGLIWSNTDNRLPKSVGLNLEWQNQAKIYDGTQTDWQFLLSRIQLDDQFIQTISPVSVQLVSKRFLHIETQAFDIQPFKPIVKAILHNEKIAQLFDASAKLLLKNVVADLAVPQLYFENISADIATLAVPVTNLPGLALQDFHLNKVGSDFKVHSDQPIWVMQPTIHPVPMRFDLVSDMTGRLDVLNEVWALDPMDVMWDKMAFNLSGSGDFQGEVDIKSQIEPKTISKVKQYLPYSIMTPKLQSWLKAALVSGEQVQGQFYFKGDLNEYPFKEGDTRFGGNVTLKNAHFKFHKDWPELQGLDATVNWSQFDLNILADQVQLQPGINAKAVNVAVGPLNSKNIAVEFSAKAKADGVAAIKYLQEGPLPERLGLAQMLANKQKIDLTGPIDVSLNKVWLPVWGYQGKSLQVDGTVNLKKNTLRLFDHLVFTESTGLLRFNQQGLESKKLTARFQGGETEFSITSNKGRMKINASGQGELDYPSIVKGKADWIAGVSIPLAKAGEATSVTLDVNAANLNWLMPAPLDNKALQGTLNSTISFEDGVIHTKGKVGELGSYDIYLDSSGEALFISKGAVDFGKPIAGGGNKSGLKVSGAIPLLDIDAWSRWDMPALESSGEGSFIQNIDWSSATLNVDEVRFIDYPYKEVRLEWANALKENFHAKLLSKEISTHLIIKPNRDVEVSLDWLQIFLPINSMESTLTTEQREQLIQSCKVKKPTRHIWPNVSFKGQNIKIDEVGVPSLTFKIEDDKTKLHFKEVAATLENRAGTLTGDYLFYKEPRISNADLKLKSNNVKNLTQLLGLKKGFSGKRATVDSNIVWQGGLECFNLLGLLGKTEYQIKEGVIEDVEPGFARLLGLLNVTSLARRLSLDLKDITTKGFAYDTIKGETHFINGKLNLKDFKLKAPSASVELKGDVDLIEREFDLKASVIPALGSSLPALSALTGVASPIGALAIYALMKVIPELNEELVTYKYDIKGPWDAPLINGGKKPDDSQENQAIDDILQRD